MKGNPAVTAGAGALGVFVAMIFTAAFAFAILMYPQSRKG